MGLNMKKEPCSNLLLTEEILKISYIFDILWLLVKCYLYVLMSCTFTGGMK